MEHSTTGVALGAIASPAWLPWLNTTAEFAAIIAPILGVIWLLVQIITKTYDFIQKLQNKIEKELPEKVAEKVKEEIIED